MSNVSHKWINISREVRSTIQGEGGGACCSGLGAFKHQTTALIEALEVLTELVSSREG